MARTSARDLTQLLYLLACESDAGELIEYALVAALIALGAVLAISSLGCQINCIFTELAVSFEKARGIIPPGQMRKCLNVCN